MKLFTHYCMGDHLICYGFIKEFANKYDEILLTTKNDPRHVDNVKRLYSSIPNVTITTEFFELYDVVILTDDEWFNKVRYWYQYPAPDIPWPYDDDMIFDRFWYKMAGVDFNKKWDNFYLKRNLDKEKEVYYDIIGLKDNEEFVFIHEDIYNKTEDRTINRKYINSSIRVISITDYDNVSILDTTYVIEKSKEAHLINSSFRTFIDLMNINHNNLYYHKYTRSNPAEQVAVRLPWKIIENR